MNAKNSFSALKQNPIALAIFGLGVLGFIYVLFLAISTFTGGDAVQDTTPISQQDVNDFKNAENNQAAVVQKQPTYKRQKKIKEKEIVGAWDATLGTARALLQLNEGTFRLIIIDSSGFNTRFYINGTYTLRDDLLVLEPDPRSKPPSEKYNYQILTRSNLPVTVAKYKGKMIWQIPGSDVDVYVPNNHAVLDRAPNKIAVWSVLK